MWIRTGFPLPLYFSMDTLSFTLSVAPTLQLIFKRRREQVVSA